MASISNLHLQLLLAFWLWNYDQASPQAFQPQDQRQTYCVESCCIPYTLLWDRWWSYFRGILLVYLLLANWESWISQLWFLLWFVAIHPFPLEFLWGLLLVRLWWPFGIIWFQIYNNNIYVFFFIWIILLWPLRPFLWPWVYASHLSWPLWKQSSQHSDFLVSISSWFQVVRDFVVHLWIKNIIIPSVCFLTSPLLTSTLLTGLWSLQRINFLVNLCISLVKHFGWKALGHLKH